MILIANLMNALAVLLDMVANAYVFILIGRALMSWVNADPYNGIVRFLYSATEPVLQPIRRRLPRTGSVDFSPVVLLFGLLFFREFVVTSLIDYARQIKGM